MNNKQLNFLLNAQAQAKNKNGKCLSEEYKSARTKLKWECANNHIWEATYTSVVLIGSWCPECYGRFSKEEGLKRTRTYAQSKGGQCLSTDYINSNSKLKWKCANNHIWEATYTSVINIGSWCPQCSVYYYKEHKIRDLLEYLIEAKFEKAKPKWNVNPKTGNYLELDGYNEDLKIAFEFQGEHHYKSGMFKKSDKDLEYIKYKDEIKKQNCIKNGVKLIIIDDKFALNQKKKILDYLINTLIGNHIKIREKIKQEDIDSIFQKITNQQKNYLLRAKEHAESKNGKCLSDEYINTITKLKWECDKGHKWESSYDGVVNGNGWCHECLKHTQSENKKNKNGLLDAQIHARNKNGECLSEKYTGTKNKMKWKCSQNHVWESTYNNVVNNGRWCYQCSVSFTKEDGLRRSQAHAKDKGGECLSTEYINTYTKLKWKCANNHCWEATYNNIISHNKWCRICSIIGRTGINRTKRNKIGKQQTK